jgi:hypothetical protein
MLSCTQIANVEVCLTVLRVETVGILTSTLGKDLNCGLVTNLYQ